MRLLKKSEIDASKTVLTLVYNADSGIGNLLINIGHKLISPETYQCNLCKVTQKEPKKLETDKISLSGFGIVLL